MPELAEIKPYNLPSLVFAPINPASYHRDEVPKIPVRDNGQKALWSSIGETLEKLPQQAMKAYQTGRKMSLQSQTRSEYEGVKKAAESGDPSSQMKLEDYHVDADGNVSVKPSNPILNEAKANYYKARADSALHPKPAKQSLYDQLSGDSSTYGGDESSPAYELDDAAEMPSGNGASIDPEALMGDAPAGSRITSYGYKGDATPDTASLGTGKYAKTGPMGAWGPLRDSSFGTSPDVEDHLRKMGVKPRDPVLVTLDDGTQVVRTWDDRGASDEQILSGKIKGVTKPLRGRVDFFSPSGPHPMSDRRVIKLSPVKQAASNAPSEDAAPAEDMPVGPAVAVDSSKPLVQVTPTVAVNPGDLTASTGPVATATVTNTLPLSGVTAGMTQGARRVGGILSEQIPASQRQQSPGEAVSSGILSGVGAEPPVVAESPVKKAESVNPPSESRTGRFKNSKTGAIEMWDQGKLTSVLLPGSNAWRAVKQPSAPKSKMFASSTELLDDAKANGLHPESIKQDPSGKWFADSYTAATATDKALDRAILQRGGDPTQMSPDQKTEYLQKSVPLKPAEKISATRDLRNAYHESPSTVAMFGKGQMVGIDTIKEKLDAMYNRVGGDFSKLTPQEQRTFVFQMNKLNDPNSAVLIGEYRAAADTLGILDRAGLTFKRWAEGEQITPQQAKEIYDIVNLTHGQMKRNYLNDIQDIIQEADTLGVSKARINIPAKVDDWMKDRVDPSAPQSEKPPTAQNAQSQKSSVMQVNSQEEYDALPSGTIYVDSHGKTKRKK